MPKRLIWRKHNLNSWKTEVKSDPQTVFNIEFSAIASRAEPSFLFLRDQQFESGPVSYTMRSAKKI